MPTFNIFSYSRDGAKVLSVNQEQIKGQLVKVLCACGMTFEKSRVSVMRLYTPLRCKQCFHDKLSEIALANLEKKQ